MRKKVNQRNFSLIVILIIAQLIICSSIFCQVNDLLNFNIPGFYLLPSQIGDHNDKWVLGSYVNTKKILSNIPVRSYALSGDYQIKRGFESIYIGVAFADKNLISSPYHEGEVYTTLAYHKMIRNHTFHFGVQTGLLFRNLDASSLVYPDQYDRNTGGFNPGVTSSEPVEFSGKALNINLNLGVGYGIKISKYATKFILAYRNLNKPELSFSNDPLVVSRQLILQNKTKFNVSNDDLMNAFLMVRTDQEKTETYLGGDLVHKLMKYNMLMNEISVGSYFVFRSNKFPNNIVLNLGLGVQNFKIGFAYAYNFIGSNPDKSDFNSFELVLIYKGLNASLDKYKVPCEIY
jgi:hypothetical protein